MFYTGDKFPEVEGAISSSAANRQGTHARHRWHRARRLNDKLWELRRETMLQDLHQRVRDVRQGRTA